MPQTFDFSGIAPAPADQAPPVGLAPMTFATVNHQRVPIDDTPDDTEPTKTAPPAAPAAPTYNFEGIAPAKPPAPPPEPSLYEKLNTSPLHPYFEAARKAVTQAITQAPGLDLAEAKANDWTGPLKLGTVSAMGRGAIAGGLEGVSKIAESFTTPTGFALWLTGLGAESAAVKAIPALKPLIALPAIQNLRAAVHGTAGAAFAAHGAGTAAGGLGTLWDAATSAQAPPEGRWGKALSGLGDIGQGTIEAATGILGVHGALEAPAVQNWQQARRTAAGAAAMNDFRLAAPPSVAAPYSTEQLQRAFPELIRDHLTNGRITTIDENISAADNQIGRLETGFNKLIDADRSELIKTKPLDAVNAALANVPRSDALAKGLKNLETLGLDRPLTVYEANQARIQLNAENDATLANNKYDVSIARKVDPAFAAREAAVASLRQGVHDVLDPRAQQTPGFTRDLRLDEGALIAVRNALLRQKYHNEATVGGSGVTSGPRRIGARALELGVTGAGAAIGGSLGAAGGPAGAAGGAVGGSIIGKELGSAIASTVNKPPISRDALIERAFSRAGALVAPAAAPTAPGGPAFPPPATPAGPGLPPPGGGPGGPGGPGGGPGLPPAAGPTAGMSPREIGVGTFLALRARGLSREQAVQSAASYVRSLPGAPEPRALPPAPPKLLGAGPRFVTDAAGQTVPIGQVAPGALIPDNGARVPTMPEGGYQRPPGRDRSSVKAVPGTYAERLAAVTAPEAAPEAATIAPDAAPAVAPESAPAARAGLVAPGGGPELPAAAGERVLAPAERTARARARAADRADARAAAAAEESQGLADLVTQAQAAGYAGDPAALRAELADRLQGIKELHAELDQSGTNGLVLLRALADNGGLSEQAAEYDGAAGELRTLKELRDTAPSTRANAGNLAKRRVLDTVRGVKGVFREDTQRQQGGFAGGQSLDSMVEKLAQDPRFYFIKNADDLSEAIHTAATGRDETRNALKDLAANSHDLIGTATHYPEDDLSFDPAALEAESQAHAAATPDRATVQRGGFGAGRPPAPPAPAPAEPPPPPPAAPASSVPPPIDDLQARRVGMPPALANDLNLVLDEKRWTQAVTTAGARVTLPDGTTGVIVRPAVDPVNGGRALVRHEMDGQPVERFYSAHQLTPSPVSPVGDTAPAPAEKPAAQVVKAWETLSDRHEQAARMRDRSAPGSAARAKWAQEWTLTQNALIEGRDAYDAAKATTTPPAARASTVSDPAAPLPADGPQKGEIVTFQMPDASAKGSHKQAGTVIGVLPDGRLDIRLQQGGFVQKAPGDLARPNARTVTLGAPAAAPEAAAPVSDVLDTGELQGRLPGAGAARQVGKADVSLRAPVQASGNDFTLETPLTDEQRAADAAKAAGPSLFDAPDEPTPARPTLREHNEAQDREIAAQKAARAAAAPPPAPASSSAAFTETMTPANRARAEAALDQSVMNKGRPIARRALVEEKIDQGATIIRTRFTDERRLQTPDGHYLAEHQISKTAMDYAQHLIDAREPEAPAPVSDVGDVGDTARTVTATGLDGKLTVTGTIEGNKLHLERTYNGQTQHKFLDADTHAATPDALRIAVNADKDFLVRELGKGSTGGPYLPDPTRSATERGGAVVLASSPAPTGETLPPGAEARARDAQRAGAPGVSADDIPLDLATRAHAGTSHVPDTRGASEQQSYVAHMNEVWQDLMRRAETPAQRDTARAEFARYRDGYIDRARAQLSQRSGLVSTMIAGPANFPAARMNKKNATYEKGVTAFNEWDQRARRAMREAVDPTAAVSISADRPDAPDALQAKIDAALKLQDQMKAINAIVRQQTNDTQKIAAMQAIGVSEDAARKALQPDFAGRKGFPSYALRNNAANIDRMQSRIADLATERARPLGAATFDGGTIKENADLNRIQVTFDGKPDEAMRAQLKANGFKWAPSMQVWQRQRTQNARDAIQRIFRVKLEPPPE